MNQQISAGQAVYDRDGAELGTVKEVQGRYIKVDAPMAPDYWLRIDDLTSNGPAGGLLVRDGAEQYSEPGDDLETDAATVTARDDGHATDSHAHQHTDDLQAARGSVERESDARTIELREEQLRVAKQREQAGEVRLGKRVEEHTEHVDVPLREERVVIERRPGSGEVTGDVIDATDQTIEVPVMRERAIADKEAVVREEVTARTEAVEHTERVQDTVRREELVVEGDGDTITDGETINAPSMPAYEREQTRRS
jgi:uncharacterized protein (TIGR02271 family)